MKFKKKWVFLGMKIQIKTKKHTIYNYTNILVRFYT